ncbi:MAG: ATPase domain-containing protein [Methanomassiliicoccales archaeon]
MNTSENEIRYRTYIQGFDENIGGGIPKGHVVLVAGETGSMKSSIAYYILFMNAENDGISGLYISLEQSKKSILRQMEKMGFCGETKGLIEILDMGEIRKRAEGPNWFDTFRFAINETKRRLNYELLVIDSLGALEIISNFTRPREDMFRLFEWLRSLDITSLIISEMPSGQFSYYAPHEADFLADGIIHLRMSEGKSNEVTRQIRCVKMREVDHATSFFTLLKKEKYFLVTRALIDF